MNGFIYEVDENFDDWMLRVAQALQEMNMAQHVDRRELPFDDWFVDGVEPADVLNELLEVVDV